MFPNLSREDNQNSRKEKLNSTVSNNEESQKKAKSNQKLDCICVWDRCEYVSQQFLLHGKTDHPWRGNSMIWSSSNSTKKVTVLKNKLFRAGILCGLQIPENTHVKYQHRIRIAQHHFPLRIWNIVENIKASTCIINTEVANRIDENITHNRLSVYKNSVQFLLTKFDHSEITDQEAQDLLLGKYVCAPTLTKSESLSEAQNLTSNRSERQTEANSTVCNLSLEKNINSTM